MFKKILRPLLKLMIAAAAAAVILAAVSGISYLVNSQKELLDDEGARNAFAELLPQAEQINEIIWGRGLEVAPDAQEAVSSVSGAQYRPVSPDAEYQSVEELRAAVAAVYSDDFIRSTINYIAFEGYTPEDDGEGAALSARYADRTMLVDGSTTKTTLNIDITNPGFTLTTEIDPAGARIVDNLVERSGLLWKSEKVAVRVDAVVNGEERELEITLKLQDGEWRFDDPTY